VEWTQAQQLLAACFRHPAAWLLTTKKGKERGNEKPLLCVTLSPKDHFRRDQRLQNETANVRII